MLKEFENYFSSKMQNDFKDKIPAKKQLSSPKRGLISEHLSAETSTIAVKILISNGNP